MRSVATFGAALLSVLATTAGAVKLNVDDDASLRAAARQYAYGLMSLYENNATSTPAEDIGIWPQPHYWWEGGAAWGGMIEYSQFTGDDSHVRTLQQALTANYGPKNDFILSYRKSQTGNDDQAFWALAAMSALEYHFPDAADAPATYLEVAVNAFENMMSRWDTATCGGGLKWQIYPENAYGYNYKNSISNGCAFALGARLARYTGEQKYADWSVKIYDWMTQVGLITDKFEVFDGSDDKTNCAAVADKTQWTYNNAMFLHGSAFMHDFTKGSGPWKQRTEGFLNHAELLFFKPFENSTDVMYEWACETGESGRHCNLDQQSFKAYLARFIAKTAVLVPSTKDTITKFLKASAAGAAKSCSGGADGTTCGSKWYTGGWDGTSGVGQQLSALEVTQALLMINKGTLPAKKSESQPAPQPQPQPQPSSTVISKPSSAPAPAPSPVAPSSSNKAELPTFSLDIKSSAMPSSSVIAQPPVTVIPVAPSNPIATGVQGANSTSKACKCTAKVTTTLYTSCTPTTTKTIYVPATPVVPPVSSIPTPITPPGNSTGNVTFPGPPPAEFTGAASSVESASYSFLGAAAIVLAAGLF